MTLDASTDISGATTSGRARPRVHFTADDGWINDPYGVVWSGDRYHLFYQAIPGRVTWAPDCTWGHADSPDLVHWVERAAVLTPQTFERGCWSGSVVADADEPVLFYTRITGDVWSIGQIARATGSHDLSEWQTDVGDVVIAGPPPELEIHTFRDPYVFRYGSEWRMLVGAGLHAGGGGVVQYRSTDLATWTATGLLCARGDDPSGLWTGAAWECPQLFPFQDEWVLLISVWDADVLYYVAAAFGTYDGQRFVPRKWQRLTYGSSAYAMSAFHDRDGRPCVISWLREEPQNDPDLIGRAGAHSVAAVITRTDSGLLALAPHPDLTLAMGAATSQPAAETGTTRLAKGPSATELTLIPQPGLTMRVIEKDNELAKLTFGAKAADVRISRTGRADESVPVNGGREVRLLLDSDVLELFGAGAYGAFRIGVAADPNAVQVLLSTPHPQINLRRF